MYKSFPVQNCAIWLAKALGFPLERVLKVANVVLRVGNVSVGLWSIALKEPTSTDPLVKHSYSSFSLLQRVWGMSITFTVHQWCTGGAPAVRWFTHPWLNVGGDEARSSATCLSIYPETGGPTLQRNRLTICQCRTSATPLGAFYTFCERNLTFFPVSSQFFRSLMAGSFIFSLFLL